MSYTNLPSSGMRKFYLLSLENKRSLSFEAIQELCEMLASGSYYFDKISRVAYDSSEEIVNAFKEGHEHYENLFVLCPQSMEKTVKDFLSKLYNASFNTFNTLAVGRQNVVIRFTDAKNILRPEDFRAFFAEKYGIKYGRTYIRTMGAPPTLIDKTLRQAKTAYANRQSVGEMYFNVKEQYGDCRIEIVFSSQTPKIFLDDIMRNIVSGLGEYIYSMEDTTLAEQLYRLLKLRRMKISVAESFTGGGVSKKIIEVPGASSVFYEGINSYSNESKTGRLGVSELTLKQCGAVSADTAYKMAEGLLKTGKCEVAISTTGIAGPASNSTYKPVGLAFLGIGIGKDIQVYKFNFTGNRDVITNTATNFALFLAYKRLK